MKLWLLFSRLNKKSFLSLLGLFALVFLLVPQQAHAFVGILLIAGMVAAGSLFGVSIFGPKLLEKGAQELLGGLQAFTAWVVKFIALVMQEIYLTLAGTMMAIIRYFINVPVVPDKVPFVQVGWDFTVGLANGVFLLILVFIGLATILRIQSYQMQRTLPLLIIVVLLVNFSAVFVGFVVDIGNLLTHFFLQGSLDAVFGNSPWGSTTSFGAESGESTNDFARISENIARILFFLFGSVLFFIIILIFGIRIIALWTITIMAPIAFAALILPATRKWWQRWLSALLDWAFIGVPMAFFLYLASSILFTPLPPDPSGDLDAALLGALAPIAALVLMFLGILFSIGLASSLGNRAQRGLQRQGGKLWQSRTVGKMKGKAAGAAQRTIGFVPQKLQAAGANLQQRGDQQRTALGKWALKGAGKATSGAGTAARFPTGAAQRNLMEYEQSKRQMPAPTGFDRWDPQRQAEWIDSLTDGADRIQLSAKMAEAGNLRFTGQAFQDRVKKDRDKARETNDGFFQNELNSIDRAYPEELTEELDLRRILYRRRTSKKDVGRALEATDEAVGVAAADGNRELTSDDIQAGLDKRGVKGDTKAMAQAINEQKREYKESREQLEESLRRDGDIDNNVGIDIEYGVKQKIISRNRANEDRAGAADDVRKALGRDETDPRKQKVYTDYTDAKGGRDKFTQDTAVTAAYVRNMRSQYVKNIADIDGDDLGLRAGLATGTPQHLREVQTNFGREAIKDIFEGAGGINDQVRKDADAYAMKNSAMWNFLQNNPMGREFPFEGRNYMKDVHGDHTTAVNSHKGRIRVKQIAEEDKEMGQEESLVGGYYDALQESRKAEGALKKARDERISEEDMQPFIDRLEQAQQSIQNIEEFFIAENDLMDYLVDAYDLKLMSNQEQEDRRTRLKEVQRLWKESTRSGRSRGRGNDGAPTGTPSVTPPSDDDGEDDDEENGDDNGDDESAPRQGGGGPRRGDGGGHGRRTERSNQPPPGKGQIIEGTFRHIDEDKENADGTPAPPTPPDNNPTPSGADAARPTPPPLADKAELEQVQEKLVEDIGQIDRQITETNELPLTTSGIGTKIESLLEERKEKRKEQITNLVNLAAQELGDNSLVNSLQEYIGNEATATRHDYEVAAEALRRTHDRNKGNAQYGTILEGIMKSLQPNRLHFNQALASVATDQLRTNERFDFASLNDNARPEQLDAATLNLKDLGKRYREDKRLPSDKNSEFTEELRELANENYGGAPGPQSPAPKPKKPTETSSKRSKKPRKKEA